MMLIKQPDNDMAVSRCQFISFPRTLRLLLIPCIGLLLISCLGPTQAQTLSGHVLIVGSTALQPLVTAAADLFQKQFPQVQIEVQGGGSHAGLRAVTDQKADIGTSDPYADPGIYPDPNLTDHIVCVAPFTMITHPGVNVNSLTRQQIIDIYSTGKITNWQQVGGQDLPIVPIVRPASSGTRSIFRKYVLGGRDESGTLLETDSNTEVRDMVARTPGAIGYVVLSVVDPKVHALDMDGFKPTLENIESGQYIFWSYEHMYTLNNPSDATTAFLDFMLTPPVQQLAQQMGYIPIATMKLPAISSVHPGTLSDITSTLFRGNISFIKGRRINSHG